MESPLASVDKLVRKAGAHLISEGAARESAAYLEETAVEIAREGRTMANITGGKWWKTKYIRSAGKRKS